MANDDNKVGDADNQEKDKSKYGEPAKYDPSFKGPIKNRGCTDIICCFLFIIFFLGMFVVGYFGYAYGDPMKLIYPSNSAGELCGYGDLKDKPYLHFFDLMQCAKMGPAVISGCPTPQVCVSSCPNDTWYYLAQIAAEETATKTGLSSAISTAIKFRSRMVCVENVDATQTSKSVYNLVQDNECAPYVLPSEPLLYRCVPSILVQIKDKAVGLVVNQDGKNYTITDSLNQVLTGTSLENGTQALTTLLNAASWGEKILNDIVASWHLLLIGCAIAMVFCFIWIVIMRWIAGIMVWLTIALFIGLFAFACYYCYSTYYELKNNPNANTEIKLTIDLDYWKNLKTTWLVLGCTAATLLTIILLVLIFLRQRLQIAIALIKEASRAIGKMMFTLLWPLIPWILQIGLFAYCVTVAAFLASTTVKIRVPNNNSTGNATNVSLSTSGSNLFNLIDCGQLTNTTNSSTLDSLCSFFKNENSEYTIYLQFYNLFMWFWVMNFIVAFGQMVLAGAFASFYWAFNKPDDIPAFAVTQSVGRTLLYHTGSLAFGSLIIAIIQIIRVLLEYADNKLKGTENQVAKFILKCLKCCFWCLEKFMKMINKNAYILIAIYGKNFCTSAKNAFFLIMRNIVRVVVIDKVTDFILFIGKLVVVGAIAAPAFFFFSGKIKFPLYDTPDLNFYVLPIALITICAFMIASGFFSVYGMCVDTLFLCFLEDLERHDGSAEKPYYMNKELMNILGKKNTAPQSD